MRIGIIGGTFNPIHLAHLRIAEEARDLFDLEKVIFVPAATPPHKPLASDLSFEHRYEMVRLATKESDFFTVSDVEGKRGGVSYLIDTLRYFSQDKEMELYFIMGSDSFSYISSWKDYADFFNLCNIAVIERPPLHQVDPRKPLPVDIARDFCYDDATKRLVHRSGHVVHFVTGTLLDISSSAIRTLIASGRSVKYLIPPSVELYIKEKGLYASKDSN